MKVYTILFFFTAVVLVECGHTFLGTNVQRPMVYHRHVRYGLKFFSKRVENLHFIMPQVEKMAGRVIQVNIYFLMISGSFCVISKKLSY